MTETERTLQPTGPLSTREQISDRLIERLRNSGGWPVNEVWQRWQNLFTEYDRDIALFSRPTLSAEPDRVIVTRNQIMNAVNEVVEDGEWSDADDLPTLIVNAILYRSNYLPDATPPRIEDMAPGTTRELDERDFPDEEEQRTQAIIDAIDDWAPSIDDMTIGTTFRAPHSNLETDHVRLWVRTSRGLLDLTDVTTDGRYTTAAVNPSTICDVTPPKD